MKGMKARLLRRLKSVPTINTLKQSLVYQVNPSEKISKQNFQTPPLGIEDDYDGHERLTLVSESIITSKHEKKPEDEELESGLLVDDREQNGLAESKNFKTQHDPSSESEMPSFQLQDLEQSTCTKANKSGEEYSSLLEFGEKCPPGGANSVILYSTSLRGIRKTFEDCNTIRFLLKSFRVLYYERDVSMDLEFREELWRIMGNRVVPPKLFIKGRYIGGAEEVVTLHEQGKLKKLLQGISLDQSFDPCKDCAGVGFVLCLSCNGSCKVFTDEGNGEFFIRCPDCNENGLVKCPNCH